MRTVTFLLATLIASSFAFPAITAHPGTKAGTANIKHRIGTLEADEEEEEGFTVELLGMKFAITGTFCPT